MTVEDAGNPNAAAPVGQPDGRGAPNHAPVASPFDSAPQRHAAARLAMCLFLAFDLMLFGCLFCAYAVFRCNHPGIFAYGSGFLDARVGALNTTVLILSGLTMALAVHAAQTGRAAQLVGLLSLTLLGGLAFAGVTSIEYAHKFENNLVCGLALYETPEPREPFSPPIDPGVFVTAGDIDSGRVMFNTTCRQCHGRLGEGIVGKGKALAGSRFIAAAATAELLSFIRLGRAVTDPLNTTGVPMPPRGANPLLSDGHLLDIIAFARTLAAHNIRSPDADFLSPVSSIPPPVRGPAGLAEIGHDDPTEPTPRPHPSVDPLRPPNAHLFFGLYFLMTGVHGLHVLAGIVLIAWLIVRAGLGHFSAAHYIPLDLAGLYWHTVCLVWFFLFPLLYLVR